MLGDILQLIALLIVVMVTAGFGLIIFSLVIVDLYVKKKVRGATLIVVYNTNREKSTRILRLHGAQSFTLEKERFGDKLPPTYTIDPSRQIADYWPPGFPTFLQQRVATYMYREDSPEPIDPLALLNARIISPRMLTGLINEGMLGAITREAADRADGKLIGRRKVPMLILIISGIIAVVGALNLLVSYSMMTTVGEIYRIASIGAGG